MPNTETNHFNGPSVENIKRGRKKKKERKKERKKKELAIRSIRCSCDVCDAPALLWHFSANSFRFFRFPAISLRLLSDSSQIPLRFPSDSLQIPLRFPSDSMWLYCVGFSGVIRDPRHNCHSWGIPFTLLRLFEILADPSEILPHV